MAKPRSLRLHLIGLVVGVLLPMWVFDGVLLIAWARHEQSAMIAAARTRTHVAAAAIDHELTSLRGRLFLLAGELSLQTNDLSDFHVRARQAFDGMTVILTSPDGREILNTNAQYGVPLPDNPDMAMVRRVVETREAYTGDLTDDPVRRRPAVEIAVPVTRDSRLAYVLSLDVSSTLPSILRQADLPDGWVGAILDRQGRIIGRNRDPDR
jgi:hypothetical protein